VNDPSPTQVDPEDGRKITIVSPKRDEIERERRRLQMEETYRDTLLGHFRPEDGIS
jgi:hypothetical protein